MPIAKLEITSCDKCPNSKSDRHYTADSFEFEFDWKCSLMEGKIISQYVDMGDSVTIPNWCPIVDPSTIIEPESHYDKAKKQITDILAAAFRKSIATDPLKEDILDENDIAEGVEMIIEQIGGWEKIFNDLDVGVQNGASIELQLSLIKPLLPFLCASKR